ncbi:MAG TPA: glutamate racemase [Patescibacteria group bacterium]|nr:glutamate racemase [Patescibacteria group bacterium]
MIGIFDSGYGGLLILRALMKALPDYSFVYFGDNARAPYGPRTKEEIFQFTLEGVEFLFDQGCEIVILGCNTATAAALRRIQQEILPRRYPEKRVLGILAPTVEAISGLSMKNVAILATQATVESGAYVREIQKRNPAACVFQQACPSLVPLIESGAPEQKVDAAIQGYFHELEKSLPEADLSSLDAVLLGCTHYGLVSHLFRRHLSENITLFDQGEITAHSLVDYLARHPEMNTRLKKNEERLFFTSGDPEEVSKNTKKFYQTSKAVWDRKLYSI